MARLCRISDERLAADPDSALEFALRSWVRTPDSIGRDMRLAMAQFEPGTVDRRLGEIVQAYYCFLAVHAIERAVLAGDAGILGVLEAVTENTESG